MILYKTWVILRHYGSADPFESLETNFVSPLWGCSESHLKFKMFFFIVFFLKEVNAAEMISYLLSVESFLVEASNCHQGLRGHRTRSGRFCARDHPGWYSELAGVPVGSLDTPGWREGMLGLLLYLFSCSQIKTDWFVQSFVSGEKQPFCT